MSNNNIKNKYMRRRSNSSSRNKNNMTMMSSSQWREKFMYPVLGIVVTATILYFNFDHHFDFPVILWQKNMGFVGVESTRFVVLHRQGGRKMDGGDDQVSRSTVYVNGWNSYWLLGESVWGHKRDKVSRMFKKAAQMGLTVCRTWAFNDGPGPDSLQVSPGVFNERVLKGLDYIIVEARKNGIRLILSLVNNLEAFGGKEQYVKWAKEAGVNVDSSPDPFFSDSTIKDYYKYYVKAIITRKNSLSGVRYTEEPAIFAWELINEPRCDSNSSAPILQAWITEMAAYTKSLDKNHLVTVGLEGFYGPNAADKLEVNPGQWATELGTDFIHNSADDNIDFASVHAYPNSWMPHANNTEKLKFISKWMDSHIADGAHILKKPVLFTEVGCPMNVKGQGADDRDNLLKTVYDRLFESAKQGQAGAGALIWQLLVEGIQQYEDGYSLVAWKEHTTYQLIIKQSCRLQHLFWKSKSAPELNKNDPCYGLLS